MKLVLAAQRLEEGVRNQLAEQWPSSLKLVKHAYRLAYVGVPCFRNFLFWQGVSFTLHRNSFNEHSLRVFTSSLLQFANMALRSLGSAIFNTCRA